MVNLLLACFVLEILDHLFLHYVEDEVLGDWNLDQKMAGGEDTVSDEHKCNA